MIANGQHSELLDKIYSQYASYKEGQDLVLVEGPGPLMGGTELDAQVRAGGGGEWERACVRGKGWR